jgi:hypothetical protein
MLCNRSERCHVRKGHGVLGTSHLRYSRKFTSRTPRSYAAKQAALTFTQWGTPPEGGPPFPSRLLSFPL